MITKIIFVTIVAAIIAVGLIDLIKTFLPKGLPTRAKAAIAIVLEAVIGILAALALSKSGVNSLFDKAIIVVATIGIANVGYNYIAKLFESIELKLKD